LHRLDTHLGLAERHVLRVVASALVRITAKVGYHAN
jgi:hypothetical protein